MKFAKATIFATLLVCALSGCFDFFGNSGGNDATTPSSTETASSVGTLYVTNGGTEKLVLFETSISEGSAIKNGSSIQIIPGTAVNFRVNASKGFYILKAVKLSDLEAQGYDYSTVTEAASQFVYVEDSSLYIQISATTSGSAILNAVNGTDKYIELHQDSFEGEVLGIVRPSEDKLIYMQAGTYSIFPVAVVPQESNNKVIGVYKLEIVSSADIETLSSGTTVRMDIVQEITPVYACAYIEITNNYVKGLKLYNGSTLLSSDLGHSSINTGGVEVYELAIDASTGTRSYGALSLKDISGSTISIPSFGATKGVKTVVTIGSDKSVTFGNSITLE